MPPEWRLLFWVSKTNSDIIFCYDGLYSFSMQATSLIKHPSVVALFSSLSVLHLRNGYLLLPVSALRPVKVCLYFTWYLFIPFSTSLFLAVYLCNTPLYSIPIQTPIWLVITTTWIHILQIFHNIPNVIGIQYLLLDRHKLSAITWSTICFFPPLTHYIFLQL